MMFLNLCFLLVLGFGNVSSALAEDTSPVSAVAYKPLDFSVATGIMATPELNDGQDDIRFEYRWYVNGEENLFVTTEMLDGENFKRGDKISIEILPYDNQGNLLPSYITRPIIVENAPPVISSSPPEQINGPVYEYPVKVSDPDDDVVTCRLESAPEGMIVDDNCVVRWDMAGLDVGHYSFTIIAEDGYDGQISQSIEIDYLVTLQEAKK